MDRASLIAFWEECAREPKRKVFFHSEFKRFLDTFPEGKNDTESDVKPGGRTDSQNRSIHLWLEMVASELDRLGHTVQDIVARIKRAEIRPNKTVLKEVLWRPYQIAALGKESTTELTKHEVDKVYEGLNKFLVDNFDGLHIPFPSDDAKQENNLTVTTRAKALPDYPEDPFEGQKVADFGEDVVE